ncbi:MAG TPA: hypothetical protein VEO20_00675 [Thermoplasmata archaeon]|nr:hypothetical protein [Thermoplasmata archaeon]
MADEKANGETNGASGENDRDLYEEYEGLSERFESDTRNYLKVHLMDEYETPAQAVIYNVLQNAVDNRSPGVPLEVRFNVDSRAKVLEVNMIGTTGIKDWKRYNSLHFAGDRGAQRRGEGAKILVPISRTVRTETRLTDGTYMQSVWKDDHIWRSDKEGHDEFFKHFPPSALPQGSTRIVAEGLFDEVGDRRAGLDLVDPRMVDRILRQDWFLLFEDQTIKVSYEIDGIEQKVGAPPRPELSDEVNYKDVPVVDYNGETVGKFERVVLRLAKSPLRGDASPAIAVCTDLHAVSYYQLYGGPNATRLYGFALGSFLAGSETTNHFAFKSTRQWRAAKTTLTRLVNQFMEKHAGVEAVEDPRTKRTMAEVTDQICQVIKNRFPDWHPEGGFSEKREPPKPGHDDPWISQPTLSKKSFDPGESCTFSFDVVGPDRGTGRQPLEARVAIASAKTKLLNRAWPFDIAAQERRSLADTFNIPEDAPSDIYAVRFSIAVPKKGVVSDRRLYFDVGEVEEKSKEPRTPRKKQPKRRGDIALNSARAANFPVEEDRVRESIFNPDPPGGPVILLNRKAPQYLASENSDEAWRYHIARCQIEELAALKFDRELGLRAQDELNRDALVLLYRNVMLERSTFLAEWARAEQTRRGKRAEPKGGVINGGRGA